MAEKSTEAWKTRLRKSSWILIMLAVWETSARFSGVSPILLPSIADISSAFAAGITSGRLLASTGNSLLLIALGIAAGTILALILVVPAFFSRHLSDLTDVLTSIGHPIPGIALLPLVILWFGTGQAAIVFIILHSVIWPMVINIRTGFREVPQHYLYIGRNYELKRSGMLFYILLPASLPFGISGLKIAWARAWRAVISAEMVFGALGGRGGLGWYMYNKRVFMDTPGMFAGILMLIIIGMLFENLFFTTLERRTLRKWGAA